MILNYAISGYDRRITLEKIHVDKCPQCGGKMKYYNKPVEWREIVRTDGSVKYEVTKKFLYWSADVIQNTAMKSIRLKTGSNDL